MAESKEEGTGGARPAGRLAFVAAPTDEARRARDLLARRHGDAHPDEADAVVVLGGDGTMLRVLHERLRRPTPLFGMNRGRRGFLMNRYDEEGLPERVAAARAVALRPLRARVSCVDGRRHARHAFNEVSLLRSGPAAASLRVSVDGEVRLAELAGDGLLAATPAGSSAYNFSAHGPIVPLEAPLTALTPVCPIRPRLWRGALLPARARVVVEALDPEGRPAQATADFHPPIGGVARVEIAQDRRSAAPVLFDPGSTLSERLLEEQFSA